jgi:hypothetical protein
MTAKQIEKTIDILTKQFNNDCSKFDRLLYIINYSHDKIKGVYHYASICNEMNKLEERMERNKHDCEKLCYMHKLITKTLV